MGAPSSVFFQKEEENLHKKLHSFRATSDITESTLDFNVEIYKI